MIPKIHQKGSSFRGAANYLLHDKGRASSSDRVAWTSTRNLATRNPHAAWRVMAATAMDQDRLKQAAGVKKTGRKSADSVLHVTLSWHPDEAGGLTRDEMTRAANGAVRALGAEDRQAMFVSHNDEPQPHVHVLINRVSPVDGRMLPSSKEKLNLSKWAQEYEAERGHVLCEQRVINNAARDRGEYTRGEPDKPRHIYEFEASNGNAPDAERTRAEQKKLDLALARKTRGLKERHAKQTAELAASHRAELAQHRAEGKRKALQERDRVRAEFRPAWEGRFHEHQAELRAFEKREEQLLGRVANALRAVDFGAIFTGQDRRAALRDAYNTISTSGGRFEAFKRSQLARDRRLEREQRAAETDAVANVRAETSRKLTEQREAFKAEHASLILTHELERAGNRTEWRTRGQQRAAAWRRLQSEDTAPDMAKAESRNVEQLAEDLKRRREANRHGRRRRPKR